MSDKTKEMTPEELKLAKENRELKKQIDELVKAQEKIKVTTEEAKQASVKEISTGSDEVIRHLQGQIDMLSTMVKTGGTAKSPDTSGLNFRPVTTEDIAEEELTFVARKVMYLVASYVDENGVEHYPPHKLILFTYAASDIKKDGNEYTIKNYCQYNTKLKTEIDYLRKHPLYSITFFDNLNAMMGDNVMDTDFRVQAASVVNTLSPEAIMDRAKEFKMFSPKKSVEEMRAGVIQRLAESYRSQHDEQNRERVKRNIMRVSSNG